MGVNFLVLYILNLQDFTSGVLHYQIIKKTMVQEFVSYGVNYCVEYAGNSQQTRDIHPRLVQCWPNIEPTFGECLVFAGNVSIG